jgi:Transposase DDE domain
VCRKDGSDDGRDPEDWRGERRSNETHESKTDPDSQLYRKKSNAAPALLTRIGGSAIDGRTTRHVGYEISQRKSKRIEQCFGWAKTVGPMRQVTVRGLDKVGHAFTLAMAAYNFTRLRNLTVQSP